MLISLDFSRLPEYKLCSRDDYEQAALTASRCFLGMNVTVERQVGRGEGSLACGRQGG